MATTTPAQTLSDGSQWLNSGWHVFPIDIEKIGNERQTIAERKTCRHMRYTRETYELSTIRSKRGNIYPTMIHRRKSYNTQGRRDDYETVDRCLSAPQTDDSILNRYLDLAFQMTFTN